ncbi:hypothetical protein CJJ23_02920 [Mycoplasmopsis agassizii]|uniref:Uncharacterized protein n=1 Tax=Mycoplasmopsis agassizii TaxID=33922 RepID=A0A269TKH7_9BACT|nr:hypothetical protein [Mycoplasmopsis agassizii]PAK21275.1 hypothetical protein CJJ23_02920 [Mycoplasmopsis agassizii]
MKNYKLKNKIKLLFGSLITGITILSSFAAISAINNNENAEIKNEIKSENDLILEKILNAESIEKMVTGLPVNYKGYQQFSSNSLVKKEKMMVINGVNRMEIVFKASTPKDIINHYIEKLVNLIKDNYEYSYAEYGLSFSIAYNDLNDLKKLFTSLIDFKIEQEILLQVNVYETHSTIKEWKKRNMSSVMDNGYFDHPTDTSSQDTGSSNYRPITRPNIDEENVWNKYNQVNKTRYEEAGFTKDILKKERIKARDNWYMHPRVKVGVLEWNGVINKNSRIYNSNDVVVGSGSISEHANVVSEVIIGNQGLNPYIKLYSSS